MLSLDPNKRLNAIKLLNHPWFQDIPKEEKKINVINNNDRKVNIDENKDNNSNSNNFDEYFDPFETPSKNQKGVRKKLNFQQVEQNNNQTLKRQRSVPCNKQTQIQSPHKKRKIVDTNNCTNAQIDDS